MKINRQYNNPGCSTPCPSAWIHKPSFKTRTMWGIINSTTQSFNPFFPDILYPIWLRSQSVRGIINSNIDTFSDRACRLDICKKFICEAAGGSAVSVVLGNLFCLNKAMCVTLDDTTRKKLKKAAPVMCRSLIIIIWVDLDLDSHAMSRLEILIVHIKDRKLPFNFIQQK